MKTLRGTMFAKILSEEFDKDGWGDIDPYLFKELAEGAPNPNSDCYDELVALEAVLERVLMRVRSELS